MCSFITYCCGGLFAVLLYGSMLAFPSEGYAQSTAVTVVSDTTDTDEASSGAYDAGEDSLATAPMSFVSWDSWGGDGFGSFLKRLFLGGWGVILPMVILLCVLLFPVLLILLLVFFLLRDRKKRRNRRDPDISPCACEHDKYMEAEKKKDRVVLNIAVGVAVTIFFAAYGWRFPALLSIGYICVKLGVLYNIVRAQKRDNK